MECTEHFKVEGRQATSRGVNALVRRMNAQGIEARVSPLSDRFVIKCSSIRVELTTARDSVPGLSAPLGGPGLIPDYRIEGALHYKERNAQVDLVRQVVYEHYHMSA